MPPKRRNSVMQTAPMLGIRLELQSFMANVADSMEIDDLIRKIKTNSNLSSTFREDDFNLMRINYGGKKKISRPEIEALLKSFLTSTDEQNGRSQPTSEHSSPLDVSLTIVEKQKMTLNVEGGFEDLIYITTMSPDDPRVVLSPTNKVFVDCDSNLQSVLSVHDDFNRLSPENKSILQDFIQKGALQAAQQELRLLEDSISDYFAQIQGMASLVITSEDKMLKAIKSKEKTQFIQKVMKSGHRRVSVCLDVQRSAPTAGGSDGDKGEHETPSRLAKKLHELQERIVASEKILKQQDRGGGALANDSRASREAWRRRIDSEVTQKKIANDRREERLKGSRSTTLAIQCAHDPSGQLRSNMRRAMAAERQTRMERIAHLQHTLAHLDAELALVDGADAKVEGVNRERGPEMGQGQGQGFGTPWAAAAPEWGGREQVWSGSIDTSSSRSSSQGTSSVYDSHFQALVDSISSDQSIDSAGKGKGAVTYNARTSLRSPWAPEQFGYRP